MVAQAMRTTAVVAVVLVTNIANAQTYAHEDAKQRRFLEALSLMQDASEKLEGQVVACEEKSEIVSARCAENEADLLELKHKVESLTEELNSRRVANPKAEFWARIAEWACQTLRDCEIKEKFAALDAKDTVLTEDVATLKAQIRDLQEQLRQHQTPHQPTSVEPRPQPLVSISPRITPIWDGRTIHSIYLDASRICRKAVPIAECVDFDTGYGQVVHGNVYYDCSGHFVIVLHRKTRPSPYVALWP